MKESIRFGFFYSVVSILVLIFWQVFFKVLTVEIFSYALWLYFFYAVIAVVVFFLFGLVVRKRNMPLRIRVAFYAILCILIVNIIPFFDSGRVLTIDVMKDVAAMKFQFDTIGTHIIAAISFLITLSFILVTRKNTSITKPSDRSKVHY